MADVKWIKIVTDIFDNRKIKQIEAMPKGDSILVVWFKLLCLAGKVNEDGMLLIAENIPFDVKSFANEFKKSAKIVQLAIDVFLQYDMIQVSGNTVVIKNWEEYQNTVSLEKIRDQTRERVRRYRQRNTPQGNVNSNVTKTLPVTLDNATEEDIDIDKDITPPIPPLPGGMEARRAFNKLFDTFWSAYPRKVGKAYAQKKWNAIDVKNANFEEIMRALDWWKRHEWDGKEQEKIPHASTWIYQKRWEGIEYDDMQSKTNATITDEEYLRMKREHEERLRRK